MSDDLDRWLTRHTMPETFPSKEAKAEYFASMPVKVKREWDLRKARNECHEPGYNSATVNRAKARMARVDALPPEYRDLVYDYGLEIVQEFLNHRVRTPKTIRHLIDYVRGFDHETGQNKTRPNVTVNQKQNPAARSEDDDYVFVARR